MAFRSRWLPHARAPYAVLLVSVTLTLLGTYYVARTDAARDELRFRATAEEIRHLIDIRIHAYVELLRAGVALFGASDTVTEPEFRSFVKHLRLERYPGIQGIGFAMRVSEADGSVPVWPAGDRDEYTSILYLEPLDERNRRAIGYDMFSEPVRRAAMERARDTGEPTASGKVRLIQETGGNVSQAGFLIYVPVYRLGIDPTSVEERRAALIGYVYSPFRTDDLLHGILDRGGPPLAFTVYDGPKPDPAALMHASDTRQHSESPHENLESTHTLDVAGRPWTLSFVGQRHFDGSSPIWLAPVTLGGGLLVSLALFAILRSQYRARESAEEHAAELRSSEELLRASESRLRRLVVLEREARAEAQAADRAKDEFLATLSHELRTPLNAMLGWIAILRAGKIRPERRADAMEVIERNAKTQARLIEDLLDVSRIITGKVQLDLQPMHLAPIVHTVVETLRPGADAKHVQLEARVEPEQGEIQGDAARMQQVVWNLVSNAIKFTPAGGHVTLEMQATTGGVQLTVRDTGIGIEADFLPHVFERFRQADSSTTRSHGGIGLGLAIVRHLVELHGGRISAESDGRDRGSRFIVWLPVAHDVATPATPPAQPIATPTA
jgi:signal transduction histidine kinase